MSDLPPPRADTPAPPGAPRILPAGDQALVVDFGNVIAPEVHERVLALDAAIGAAAIPGVVETVPTYRSLMVCYDPEGIRGAALSARIEALARAGRSVTAPHRLWHVPVLYGGAAGLDFEDLQRRKDLSAAELIALHGSVEYRVYMIGFAPGFTYLGGLPERLHTPRLKVPRQLTAAGGIAIGGAQASVGALPSPSGWRFLGRTPLRSFDPARDPAFVFRPGDRVRFHPVSPAEADRLDRISDRHRICAEVEIPA